MTIDHRVREADTHTGDDLGQTIFANVQDALHAGADCDGLIAMVTRLHDYLGDAAREEDQDAVAVVLDSLTGYCSPSAALKRR